MKDCSISPSISELQHKFMKIGRLHHRAVENQLRKCGLHRGEHRMLLHLSRCDHTPSQKELAEKFEISPAAVAVCLKKLENSGYIIRNSSNKDNRQKEIAITEKGREIVNFSRAVFEYVDGIEFNSISDEEKQSLYAILDKILINLKEINDEGIGS